MERFKISDIEAAIAKNKTGARESVFADISCKIVGGRKEVGDTWTFVMSDETRDRDGEVMKMSGARINSYNDNPLVLWMHQARKYPWQESDYDPDNVIGKGAAYMSDGKLMNDIQFEPREINERAWKVESKLAFGSINAGSIGFIPHDGHWGDVEKGEDSGTYYITDWELTEYSIVTIPANPNARVQKEIKDNPDGTTPRGDDNDKQNSQSDDEDLLESARAFLLL